MRTIFSTDDVQLRDRFAYWHEVACERVIDHASKPASRETFEATLQAGSIGDVRLMAFETEPFRFAHTRIQASSVDSDDIILCRQVAGTMLFEQDGRSGILHAGDMTILDPQRPYTGDLPGKTSLLLAKIPRGPVEARLGPLSTADFSVLSAHDPDGDFISTFMAMLPAYADRLDPHFASMIQEQLIDLLSASLAKAIGKSGMPGSSTMALTRLRLRAIIDSRLADPHLNVRDIAAEAGVSVRYANEALAREQTSIMRLVLAKRLARCRQALEDPLQNHRTISEIAYGWGFSDMTHFSRRFLAAFGSLPRDYRHAAKHAVS